MAATLKAKPAAKASGNGHSVTMTGPSFDAAMKASGEFQTLKAHVVQLDQTVSAGFTSLEGRFDELDKNPMVRLGIGLTGAKRITVAAVAILITLGSAAYGLEHLRDLLHSIGL